MYYILTIIMLLISLFASFTVKSRFKKYSKHMLPVGWTGAQIAQSILQANGIYDVNIRKVRGNLTDNYNPITKTLNLSDDVYGAANISAACVAAHECGHAIQHAQKYPLLIVRKAIIPVANICSIGSYISILLGMFLNATNFITIGCLLFSVIVFVHLVTLPVEIDASKRALANVESMMIIPKEEMKYGKKILFAAGMTYFISLLSSIIQLLRLLALANRRR